MQTNFLEYADGKELCEGFIAIGEGHSRRPAVLIVHTWMGLGEEEKKAAQKIAGFGYAGFAVDVYGKGKRGGVNGQEASALMKPFVEDRALLRRRLLAAVEAARAHPGVDPTRLAIMGFCFGGLCALDVARSGHEAVKGAISLHGTLNPPSGESTKPIHAKVLVLHGYEDPMVKPEAVLSFANEMREAKADWQVHAYGQTMHGFTNPKANDPSRGVVYNETADRRAWVSVQNFLAELFG
jgi:dienelactone hydrolase